MKKLISSLLFFSTLSINAQYCLFFDFKTDEPEMVVSTISAAMNTDWAKNIEATKSLFAYLPNGTTESTHSIQFCFPNEEAFENAFISYEKSLDAKLLLDGKLSEYSIEVSQSINMPVWYNGEDWAEDNVFVIYQMDVSNPGKYLKEFKSFSQKMAKKLGYEKNSYGLAIPIIGKNSGFSHFAWFGSPDIKTALSNSKKSLTDPLFAEFTEKVSEIRKVVNTVMSVRVMDF
mgnify:CR=1 FL=1|tara:strand:+ start:328 stop:1020 length:693 start_codon:yes stop_codon:yes gene_type:complete